ncbi:hypothetical protein C0J52_22967 [Blattella germanica]|nr:hypothetical protein C0J52_22967 [Blattella germanica]
MWKGTAVLENNAGNAVISPVSVYTLLAIVQQGAVGTTRTEVDNVVHAQPENTRLSYRNLTARYQDSFPRVTLEFSTRAFAASTFEFKSEFKQKLVDDFQSGIDNVNFTNSENATAFINNWVSQSTHQKINQLFESSVTWHYLSGVSYRNVDDMEFIADQPFLFFIVDRINHVPLFAGRVTNPSLS